MDIEAKELATEVQYFCCVNKVVKHLVRELGWKILVS